MTPRALPYLAFFLTGVVTTFLGPILPWLGARWAMTDSEAGALFMVQFAASLVAGFSSGIVAGHVGERRTVCAGLACRAVGIGGIAAGGPFAAVAAIAMCGVGIGLTVPTTNMLVARTFQTRASSAVSAVNLAWGAGAATWPLAVAAAGAGRPLLLALGLLLCASALFALRIPEPIGAQPRNTAGSLNRPRSSSDSLNTWRWPFFGVFFFLYGGSEAAVGGWMTELTHRLDASASAALAAAAFWGGLAGGRAVVAALVADAHERMASLGGVGLAILAVSALIVAGEAREATAAGAIAGFGLAPLFPVMVAVLSRHEAGAAAAGPLISMSGVGGALLPWLVGLTSSRTGSLQTGLLVPLAGCLAIGLLQAAFWARRRPAHAL